MNTNPPSNPNADHIGSLSTDGNSSPSSLIQNAINFGYRPIPVFSDGNRAPYGHGQRYLVEANQWKNAIYPALALDNLILVDFDGYKGESISPDEFANHFGIDDRTMADALFQWDETRNSSHYLFKWPERIPRDSGYNQTLTDILEINGKRHVDLKTGNQLVSLKPGKRINWRPAIGWSNAPDKLVAFFRKPERDTAKTPNPSPPKTLTNGDGTPYGLSALRSACDAVRGAAEGGRNAALNAQSCAMGSLVAGGELAEQVVRAELETAAEAVGLHHNETLATIQSGMSAGLQQPRSAPPRPERPPPCPVPTNNETDWNAMQTDMAAWQDVQSSSPVPANHGNSPPLSPAAARIADSMAANRRLWEAQQQVRQPQQAQQPPPVTEWPDITPLNTELPPVDPITPDMVPDELRDWLVDVCERMDSAPFEYAAVAAVVAMGSLIGRKVGIYPKGLDSWQVIPNVWGALIGRPAMKKSPVIDEILKPLNELEKTEREKFDADKKSFEVEMKMEEMLNRKAEKDAADLIKKGDINAARLLLADAADTTPDPPVARRYTVNDATVQKLGVILENNPQGLLLLRDELSGWLLGLTRDDRQDDRAFYLEAWKGLGTFSFDRIGREDVFIKSTTVSVLGGIQPGKLLPVLTGQANGSGDDGLVERIQLAVYPDKPLFKYVDRTPNREAAERAKAVFERLDGIPFDTEQETPVLRFTDDAQELYKHWYTGLNNKLSRTDLPAIAESHLGKYTSLVASLALIFHVVDNGHKSPVNTQSLEKAICWSRVLKTHARRMYSMVHDELAGAMVLVERLDKLPSPFKKRQIRDKGWSMLTNIKDIDNAVGVLVDNGYLVEVTTPPESGRGRPVIDYWINPKAIEE